MYLSIPIGKTSKIIQVPVYNSASTIGALLAGLVFNSAGLTASYNREGAAGAAVDIPLVTATKGTWVSGGFVAVDATKQPGAYELHIPDAALPTGAESVLLYLRGAANMVPVVVILELGNQVEIAKATWDRVLTGATHNIASSAGRRLRAVPSSTLLAGVASAGSVDGITLTGGSATDGLYVGCGLIIESGTGAGQARYIVGYVGSTNIAKIARHWTIAPDNTSAFQIVADNQIAYIHMGVAQAGSANSITLQSVARAENGLYVGQVIRVMSGIGDDQDRMIIAYDGTTKVATVDRAWATNPSAGDFYATLQGGTSYPVLSVIEASAVLAKEATVVARPVLAAIEASTVLAKEATSVTIASYIDTEITTLINRLGAFTGTGVNTVLGFLKALMRKDLTAPSDVGGTFDPATASTEALAKEATLATSPTVAQITAAIIGSQLAQNVLISRVAVTDDVLTLQEKNVKTLDYNFGAVWDLTGKKLFFTVKSDKEDALAAALINTDITAGITSAATGVGSHSIIVPDDGDYHYEYTRYAADGTSTPETVMIGILKSRGSVRK